MNTVEFKELIFKYLEKGYYYPDREKDLKSISEILWNENTNDMESVFSGEKIEYLVETLGEKWAEKFRTMWNRASEFTYSVGYYRRPFRSKVDTKLYFNMYLNKLIEFIGYLKKGFTLENYFNQREEIKYNGLVIGDILANEINENNEYTLMKIKDIIYGDNQNGYLTRNIIKGLLMSNSEEAYKMVGDLLLAAKLQEGLRQTILESVDETTIEGFKYILNIILQNDLLRFSSVVRAVGVWTGLVLEAEKPSLVKKVIENAAKCIQNEEYKRQSFNSDDAIEIYCSLWAEGFVEIRNTEKMMNELINSDKVYKKLTALYFLNNTQDSVLQFNLSKNLLRVNDIEIVAYANNNIDVYKLELSKEEYKYLFDSFKYILDNIKKEEVFNPSLFPWNSISISKENILSKMLKIATDYKDDYSLDILSTYTKDMDIYSRRRYIEAINEGKTKIQREALILSIGDKSDYVRVKALEECNKLSLTEEEYEKIEGYTRFKSGDLRKGIIGLLLKQNPESLYGTIERLLNDKLEEKKLVSLDLIYGIKNNKNYEAVYKKSISLIENIKDPSNKEQVIIDKILDKNDEYSLENGFMLYDPKDELNLEIPKISKEFDQNSIFKISEDRIKEIMEGLNKLIEENKDYEYEIDYYDGTRIKVVFGAEDYFNPFSRKVGRQRNLTIGDYPLSYLWRRFLVDFKISAEEILLIEYINNSEFNDRYKYYDENEAKWFSELKSKLFDLNEYKKLYKLLFSFPYSILGLNIISVLKNDFNSEEIFECAKNMSLYLYNNIPSDCWDKPIYEEKGNGYYYRNNYTIVNDRAINYWINSMENSVYDDESFKMCFAIKYNYYKISGYKSITFDIQDIVKAFDLKTVNENEIYKELMEREDSSKKINAVTNTVRKTTIENGLLLSEHYIGKEIVPKVIERILDIEVKRGELSTEVSHLASEIKYFEGIKYFTQILLSLGKDTFVRGYNYMWNGGNKKEMLSHLLKNCYPKENEGVGELKELLNGKKVSNSRLIEASMYAPQWISIVEKYLGWSGLSSACWYFHAHVNENFSSLKETMVARYSPITPQEFQDGAFDIKWFKEAYKKLGEEKFKIVYDAAKYITAGSNHRRAQLFSDAVLSKLALSDVEERIENKRNKDYVLCFGLMPLSNKKIEVLNRYEFLQKFLKESKNFGAQRRESEGKVVSIALDNLSRNAGYDNVTRFTWAMEGEKIKELKGYLNPKNIGDFTAFVNVDEEGKSKVKIFKGEKELKTLPAAIKKDPYIEDLKKVEKDLKNQLSRSKRAFEKAMEDSEEFTVSELNNILLNPVLAPTLKKLVFKSNEQIGYFEKNKLTGADGEEYTLKPLNKIIIAHPLDLYESGKWSAFQRDIFNKELVQPFKQVFRELYIINEDEKQEGTISRRYAGHQVQPQKTVALLRGRGWTVNYETGLQRVYYKENIIAEIYALADWFSPSDVESPTIEQVRFFERNTYKPIKLEDIPKKIFSEVMRDVDLVVSVAHVGGVDPEASLSTIEMRGVILEEIARLMKLKNVEIKGSHAHINGSLGEYTVHLGSAIAHKMGRGSLYILPVHSQHRGRLFLPFIDEDPKTAEVTSKVIFLAEDSKIKDPSVLEQIL